MLTGFLVTGVFGNFCTRAGPARLSKTGEKCFGYGDSVWADTSDTAGNSWPGTRD